MVRIKSKFLLIFFIFSFTCISSNAEAFLGLLPGSVLDPGALATQLVDNVNAGINKVGTYLNGTVKRALNLIKSAVDKFDNLFSKKDGKIPGTKQILRSKIADIYDEASIRQAFKKLFFVYPSDQPRVMNNYRRKGREFYDDTLIESFTAVRELEKQLSKLDQKIIDSSKENSQASDYNGGLNNLYKLNITTDEILIVIQELVAIKAQMMAAEAVLERVEPLYYGRPTVGIKFD